MSFLALASSALLLGFLHGLGADHLMAITALAVDGPANRRQARAMRTAVGFAFGHALLLSFGTIAAVTLGLLIPAAISNGAERLGGGMLLTMGAFGLWSIASGRSYGHIHGPSANVTGGAAGAVGRWHLHLARATGSPAHAAHPGHAHGGSIVPLVLGALFAISSLRAVLLLQPFTPGAQALALPSLLILIALFAIGILLSMSLFGVLLARVLSLRAVNVVGRAAAATVATASVALGLYWMVA